MDAYENYLAKRVPVVFFPTATGDPTSAGIDLISKHLGGFINNVYTNMTPENLTSRSNHGPMVRSTGARRFS